MTGVPTRVSIAQWIALACACAIACGGRTDTALAQRATESKSTPTVAATTAPPSVDPPPAAPAATVPAASSERVELWIDLDPKKTVRVLTVGMLELPLMNKPTGYAREETLTFRDCVGEAKSRQCVIEHVSNRFQAEPPTGKILEQDEQRFTDVRSHHVLDAHGLKIGDATVIGPPGPPDFADTDLARSLVAAHRFSCLRLPTEAIAVGAKWSDSCSLLFGGQLARQDVAWELTALSDDPVSGTRAELTMIGRLSVADPSGERVGTIEGKLFFFVDAHAPHIFRLRARMPLKAGQKLETNTTISLQFGLVDAAGVVTRTDGQPLPTAPVPGAAGIGVPSPEPAAPVPTPTPTPTPGSGKAGAPESATPKTASPPR